MASGFLSRMVLETNSLVQCCAYSTTYISIFWNAMEKTDYPRAIAYLMSMCLLLFVRKTQDWTILMDVCGLLFFSIWLRKFYAIFTSLSELIFTRLGHSLCPMASGFLSHIVLETNSLVQCWRDQEEMTVRCHIAMYIMIWFIKHYSCFMTRP
jgi:hypothetical protein